MFTRKFWADLAERTIATVAENAFSLLVVSGAGLLNAKWVTILSIAGMAGLLAVLKSLGAGYYANQATASLVSVSAPAVTDGKHADPAPSPAPVLPPVPVDYPLGPPAVVPPPVQQQTPPQAPPANPVQ